MLTATRRFTFDSCHVLPNHPGKCSRPHGHTYIVEVTVTPLDNDYTHEVWKKQGFFIDFGLLKDKVARVLDKWDHHDLNGVDPYPTAERLVLVLWNQLNSILYDSTPTCCLVKLRLHETPNNWVEYDGSDHCFSHIGIPPTELPHATK